MGRSVVRAAQVRVAGVVGVIGLLLGAASCGDATPGVELPGPPAPRAREPGALVAAARAGVRVDLTHEVHHLRGLVRQPDGSYHSVCVDAPDGLRPAAPTGGPAAPAPRDVRR